MKTYKNLHQKVCLLENLKHAFLKARKGKTKKIYVLKFEENLKNNLEHLQKELLDLSYSPGEFNTFIVQDPKTRIINAPPFRDRIVHHVIIGILEPIFNKFFIFDSYAGRKGKGTHTAVKRFDSFLKKVSRNGQLLKRAKNKNQIIGYTLKIDIKHYFDSISHEMLLNHISQKIKDKKLLILIERIIKSYNFKEKGKGLPLGCLTSQFFGNFYLHKLDKFIKNQLKAKYYLRYMDDLLILHSNKEILVDYLTKIEIYLKYLKLEVHPQKSRIIPLSRGIDFVGFRNFYHYKLLRKRNIRKMFLKVEKYKNKEISKEKLLENFQGWNAYAMWANSYNLKRRVVREIYSDNAN